MGECLLCGWTEEQFWLSSFRAVFNLIRANGKREQDRIKQSWEQTRMLSEFIIAPYRKKSDKSRAFDLPWDIETTSTPPQVLTPEEIKERFAKRDARIKKKLRRNGEK